MRATKLNQALSYTKALVECVMRDTYVRCAVIILGILLLIPMFYPLPMGDNGYTRESFEAQWDSPMGEVYLAPGSPMPQALGSAISQSRALIVNILSAHEGSEYWKAVAAYENYRLELAKTQSGTTLTDDFDVNTLLEARVRLLQGIASSGDPIYFWKSTDVRALYYVPYVLANVPYFLVFLPVVAVALACCRASSQGRLLAHVPLGFAVRYSLTVFSLFATSLCSLLVVCVPGFLVALLKNGLGDISYPVVYVSSGQIVETSMGAVVAESFVLGATVCLMLSLVMSLIVMAKSGPGCISAFILVVGIPLIPAYYGGAIPQQILAFLPTTYLNVPAVVGYPDYLCGLDIAPIPGCTLWWALLVLLAWSTAVAVTATLCGAITSMRRRFHAQSGKRAD